MTESLLIGLGGLVLATLCHRILFAKCIVHEYEAGLLYVSGRFRRRLDAGAYRLLKSRSEIVLVDLRQRIVQVAGQELLSADNVGLKVSVTGRFRVSDPEKAVHGVQDYTQALYSAVQLALRETVACSKIDELLENRLAIGRKLLELVAPQAEAIGLELISLDVKDVMFPGELKKIFAEVVRAQKEGQAALERARGETAALRNLANAAKMLEDNPALMNLRLLQSVGGSAAGNTLVFGMPPGLAPITNKVAQDGDHARKK